MHNLIEKLLNKRGIKNVTELQPEEKATFDKWSGILTDEVTVDTILEFCKNQLNLIELQWKDLNNSKEKNERLILLHTVYKTLVDIITSPKAERMSLEKYINQLLD